MYRFFHGWRRKAGGITLVMACVMMAGWVRSSVICEAFFLRTGKSSIDQFYSVRGQTWWIRLHEERGWLSHTRFYQSWTYAELRNCNLEDITWRCTFGCPKITLVDVPANVPEELTWRWKVGEFEVGEFPEKLIGQKSYLIVPYWSITTPLALVSAYLILWKPRKPVPSPPQS
ncbi:MAG: hypothetical protein JWP89_1887 [Schlesneria sp.]|nr:hypothetical protein [Schlesneria sp.]